MSDAKDRERREEEQKKRRVDDARKRTRDRRSIMKQAEKK